MPSIELRYNDLHVDIFSYKYNDIYLKTAGTYDISSDSRLGISIFGNCLALKYDLMTYSVKK